MIWKLKTGNWKFFIYTQTYSPFTTVWSILMVRGSNKEGVAPCHHLKLIRRSQLRCPTSGVICGWAALSTTTKTCTSLYASFHPIGPNPGPSSWRSKETTATRSLSHTATSRSWYSGLPPAERDNDRQPTGKLACRASSQDHGIAFKHANYEKYEITKQNTPLV